MSTFDKDIKAIADELGLSVFSNYRDNYDYNKSFSENLLTLLEIQKSTWELQKINRRLKLSGMPYIKTYDQFEFDEDSYPNLNINNVKNMFDCEFIRKNHDIVMIGPPGTGKTHLAIALGVEAIKSGFTVKFFTAANLITKLVESKTKKSLDRAIREINRTDLVIIDEFGYFSFYRKKEIELLFQVISGRYACKSTIVTTNHPYSRWGSFIADAELATVIADRLTEYSQVFNMTGGKSYRLTHSLTERQGK